MNITLLEIAGFESSMKAMRLPHRSGEKSDSGWMDIVEEEISNDRRVIYDTFDNSLAFTVGPKDLTLAQKLIKGGPEHAKCMRGIVVWLETTAPWYWFNELDTYCVGRTPLSSTSSMHVDCKGLTGEELQKAKGDIRGDYEYTRIWHVNYQCLRNMYHQRRKHRLPEWRQFCDFIETLPLSKELITL